MTDAPEPTDLTAPADPTERPAPTGSTDPTEPSGPTEAAEAAPGSGPPLPLRVPTVVETVRSALNALVESGGDLRLLSIVAVVFGVVLVAAPLVAAVAYFLTVSLVASFGAADDPLVAQLAVPALIALVSGAVAYFVFLVQFPLVIIAVVGGRVAGQPLELRQGLRRARQVFWRALGASVIVGLVAALPAGVITLIVSAALGPQTQLALGLGILVSVLLSSPWVYVLPGIVLGGVGAIEAIRRSWRLARFRWRLALTIALLGVVGGQIVLAAAFATVGAVLTAASLAPGSAEIASSGSPLIVGGAILVAAVIVSSLFFATQAVEVAPETSGFYALTRYAAALEEARTEPREPLLRRPARVIYPVGLVATAVLAVGLLGSWPISERGPWQRQEVGALSFELPAGWRAEDSVLTAAFSNGSDGRLSIGLGAAAGSIDEAVERHFGAFLPVEEVIVVTTEEIALGETPVREATVVGRLLFFDFPVLVEAGRIASTDVALVIGYPAGEGPLADFYLGEARRFARHIWLSAIGGS